MKKKAEILSVKWPAVALAATAIALPALLGACASARQVDATPPSVSYHYDSGAREETEDRAEDYCDRYGLEPVVESHDTEDRFITYTCE